MNACERNYFLLKAKQESPPKTEVFIQLVGHQNRHIGLLQNIGGNTSNDVVAEFAMLKGPITITWAHQLWTFGNHDYARGESLAA